MRWWDKFCLLMWKNWKLQLRRPISFLVEIGIPLLVVGAFLLIRYYAYLIDSRQIEYPPLPVQKFEIPSNTLSAYSPNNNDFLNNLMSKYREDYGMKAEKDSSSLENYLINNDSPEYDNLLGIQFDDNLPNDPKNIKNPITINLRYGSKEHNFGDSWYTDALYMEYNLQRVRNPGNANGGPPNYHLNNFDGVMYQLTNDIMKYMNKTSIPPLFIRRFPEPQYTEDLMLVLVGSSILYGLLFMTSFVYACTNLVKSITLEKEKQLKESMKIMGLPTWLHWTAWFIQMFIPFFIVAICMTIGMKIQLRYGCIFPHSNWFLLFIFFVLYIIGLITYSFALSVFFSKANKAASLAGIIWILSIVPYIIVRFAGNYSSVSPFTKYTTSLFLTSAVAYGFDIIALYESQQKGIQWENLFSTTLDNDISCGGILIMLIVDAFLYLAIALYVEQIFPGDYGVPQKWYFLFTSEFWSGQEHIQANATLASTRGEFFEEEPTGLEAGIIIKKLGKTFGANDAVKDLSMNLYEDQITVLLGHNGAGKTTTMSMLTGMFPPTRGTALINGYDIRTQIMDVRDSMGLCPQHNVLFDDLTVREHLQFFSKLKGCKGDGVDREVEKYLELLSLQDKADAKSASLSGGMKRKLCVGIALCGNSKVIMLDEPTAGMDPSARRFIWEFLQKQKKGRTILLTTHFMDEADLLGDRIAIMSGGELKCCGSSFFLKKKFGTGYHLIIDQLPNCQVEKITKLIRKYIPKIQVESNAGTELTYLLPEDFVSKFPHMLSEIEKYSDSLGIRSFGISLTDLEEVFMKVGTNETGRSILRPETRENGYMRVDIKSSSLVSGIELYKNQVCAISLKKFLSKLGSWEMELLKTILPVIYILLLINMRTEGSVVNQLSRAFTLDDYDDPITLIEKTTLPEADNYKNILGSHKYKFTPNMGNTILNLTEEDATLVKYKYIVGASFTHLGTVAWFNNEPYHSLPLSVQLVLNSFTKKEGVEMNFVNYPLPRKKSSLEQEVYTLAKSVNIEMSLSVAAAYIGNFYILFNIKERVSQAKHLQFVSGINVLIFSFISFIIDFISYMIPVVAVVATFAIFRPDGMSTFSDLSLLMLIFVNFGVAVLPFMYVCSYFFTVPSTGYSRMFFISFAAGFPATSIMGIMNKLKWDFVTPTTWALRIIPHYDFAEGSINIVKGNALGDWLPQDMSMSFLISIVCFGILLLIDFNLLAGLRYKLFPNNVEPKKPDFVDEDVESENTKVRTTPLLQLQNDYVLVLKDLTKSYKKVVAVNGLNLTVKKSECFGLLGVNGAGKTTTFKMMTGDEMISFGNGWVNSYSIKSQMKSVHRFIGYCPQFDALLDNLTPRETLKIFSLIRGVPRYECDFEVTRLAKDFDFTEHLDKKVKELSGGNKRKLSTAIALIGDSPIIFLDEPTTGMDPGTKRHLWNQLRKIRESGKSIILTSHSMEECEALCTRLAIMVNGNFQCLGSTQHLKSRFAEGFSATLKIRKLANSSGYHHADTTPIEEFMNRHFPGCELRERHQELLTYFIKDRGLRWSELFAILEKAKAEMNVEDYSIGQASLEQVFLTFTKSQVSNEDIPKKKSRCFQFC
ncbi:hypothetical protein HHI36_018570 [Cryptolaemus montrouzieri]|uniref:ABC transporter domain-containing protein n=1 Tax=Cryptolaemus montrouzieri TaxID=559131 RepID=A0ABD2P0D7_9CUCU